MPAVGHRAARPARWAVPALVAAAVGAVVAGSLALPDRSGGVSDRGGIVSAVVLPPLVAPGERPEPADAARVAVDVTVRPAEPGSPVRLQARRSGAWEDVAEAVQDAGGSTTLVPPSAEAGIFRAVAGGIASTPVHSDAWEAPDLSSEFGGDGLPARWGHRYQGYAAGGRRCSRTDSSAAEVTGGLLLLRVLDDPDRGTCTDDKGRRHDYRLNGHVSTEGRYTFRYGVAAARVRFQPRRGQHGAFWMQVGDDERYGEEPDTGGAEIDVVEWFGGDHPSGGLATNLYYFRDGEMQHAGDWIAGADDFGGDWADRFHVFSVEWTPEEYVFRIDGQETMRLREGVSQVPEFLVLSLLSADYERQGAAGAEHLPQEMAVDWVRVWRR